MIKFLKISNKKQKLKIDLFTIYIKNSKNVQNNNLLILILMLIINFYNFLYLILSQLT